MTLPLLPLGLALASCASVRDVPAIVGAPTNVDGERVTDDRVKLALIYGLCPQKLEIEKTRLTIDYELARQAREKSEAEAVARAQQTPFATSAEREEFKEAARARIAKELATRFEVSDADCKAEFEHNSEDFTQRNPKLDLEAEILSAVRSADWYRAQRRETMEFDLEKEIRRAYLSLDLYREQLRQTMRFDRVFLPENPAEWPSTTVNALRADREGGRGFLLEAQLTYQARLRAAEGNRGKLPREDPLFMGFRREIVRNSVLSIITIRPPADGLDTKLALWADLDGDGKPERTVTIEELWNHVRGTVIESEVEEAERLCVSSGANHAGLEPSRARHNRFPFPESTESMILAQRKMHGMETLDDAFGYSLCALPSTSPSECSYLAIGAPLRHDERAVASSGIHHRGAVFVYSLPDAELIATIVGRDLECGEHLCSLESVGEGRNQGFAATDGDAIRVFESRTWKEVIAFSPDCRVSTLTSGGDLDGDGCTDLVVSGYALPDRGTVLVTSYSGSSGKKLRAYESLASNSSRITAVAPIDVGVGRSVPRLLVGYGMGHQWAEQVPGRVVLFDLATEQVMATACGEGPRDCFGASLAVAGDCNGDGVSDFVVGAPQGLDRNTGVEAGPGYLAVVSGRDASIIRRVAREKSWQFGRQVCTVPDGGVELRDFIVGSTPAGIVSRVSSSSSTIETLVKGCGLEEPGSALCWVGGAALGKYGVLAVGSCPDLGAYYGSMPVMLFVGPEWNEPRFVEPPPGNRTR